jgi:hypothetical protein
MSNAITGRRIDLGEGRVVFVGRCDSDPGTVFVGFRNVAGDDTKIKLSSEAFDALRTLVLDPAAGIDGPFPQAQPVAHWLAVQSS